MLVTLAGAPALAQAPVATASTATAAPAGGLFGGELPPSTGLFGADPPPSLADELPPASSLFGDGDGAASFTPRVSWSVRLGATVSLDTSFDRRGENVFELGVYGRLELHADLLPNVSAHVLPAFTQVTAIDREGGDRAAFDLNAPEAYVSLSFDRLRFRLGTLVHAWGSTDIVVPTNVLNPVDLRRSIAAAQDGTRIPVLGAEAVLDLSPLTLRAVVEPFFAASRFYLAGWDSGFAPLVGAQGVVLPDLAAVVGRATADRIGDEVLVVDRPSDRIDHLTLGLRATLTTGDLEVSGSFVWGYEALPRLALDPDLAAVGGAVLDALATEQPIDLFNPAVATAFGNLQDKLTKKASLIEGTYARRAVAGLDATYALDPLLLKLDAAFTTSRTLYTQTFAPISSPAIDAVLGLEYVDGETVQVELEGFVLTALDVPAGTRLAVLEPRGLAPGDARAVVTPGAALAARYAVLDGELALQVLVAVTFTRHDLVFAPQVVWKPVEHHQLRLGGLLVEGEPDGYGGAYTHNDQLVIGYEWAP